MKPESEIKTEIAEKPKPVSEKKVVLSGIRATGRLHFGNYLGAVRQFVEHQDNPNEMCMYFVANYHSLTNLPEADTLRGNLIEMVTDYLAAGLDPERSIIYVQSSVPEITELSLMLSMLQPLGQLQGLATVKDMVRANDDRATLGLVTYPVLMAADIAGPKANLIPVGKDQMPNIELTRDLLRRFNEKYGQTFPIPEPLSENITVPGLKGGKMGKSDASNAVDISSPIEEIRRRYLKFGITDPKREKRSDPGNPDECVSVYPVHRLLLSDPELIRVDRECRSAEIGCLDCKNLLLEKLARLIGPFQEKRRELEGKRDHVVEILHEGGKKARSIISATVAEVRDKMGIVIY